MTAYQDWVGSVANVVTAAGFVGSLSMCRRIWNARSSFAVAFWPIASATICSQAWIIYGNAIGNFPVMWVNVIGFFLSAVNATVHRSFSRTTGPGLATAAVIGLMCAAPVTMDVTSMRYMALCSTVACNLAPIERMVAMTPLPDIAAWMMASCALWTAYAMLAGDVALAVTNLVGAVVAVVELGMTVCFGAIRIRPCKRCYRLHEGRTGRY